MAINIRKTKSGAIRYEARLSSRRFSGCKRFDTQEQAEAQIVRWKEARDKEGWVANESVDILAIQNRFLLGRA